MLGFLAQGPARTAAASAALLGRMIREDARGATVDEWVADAARDGRGRGGVAAWDDVARALAARVARQVAYVRDEYGRDDAQGFDATVARGAGDCEDFAVAFGALALHAGYRVGLAFLRDDDGAPVHVLPVLEDPREARWVPVELTRAVPFGTWPHDVDRYDVVAVVDAAPTGLGFLDALIGGVVSLFKGNSDAKAAKKVAADNRAASERNAAAIEAAAKTQKEAAIAVENAKSARLAATLATATALVKPIGSALLVASLLPRALDLLTGPKRRKGAA